MMIRHLVSAGIVLGGLFGCTTVRLYPVCQYNGTVDAATFSVYSQSIAEALRVMRVGYGSEASALLPDRKYLAVRAAPWKHVELQGHWKDLGCLGSYSDPGERAKYISCREYLRRTSLSDESGAGAAESLVLCFSADECKQRIPPRSSVDAVIYCNGS